MSRRASASICLLILTSVLVACGEDGPSPGTGADAIEGVTWVLSGASMDALVEDAPENARADLTFEAGSAGGSAACNSYSGAYEVDGNTLSFQDFAVTEMGCEEPFMAIESAYLSALVKVTGYTLSGGALTLTGGPVILMFDTEPPPEPLPLTGTTWRLESIVSGDGVSSTIAGTKATLVMEDDGSASGNATCNTFSGSYEADDGGLVFGPLATTKLACNKMGAAQQEQQVLAALAATGTFVIEGDQLTLSAESGEMLLTYRAT
jgi:heat shock protein HslJ